VLRSETRDLLKTEGVFFRTVPENVDIIGGNFAPSAYAKPRSEDDMQIKLKSGRTVYANRGIFGLAEEDGEFAITQGYDGSVRYPRSECDDPDPDALTADDIREIADMMIARWTRFRVSLPSAS
jgi:hypothetical protein